jgi:ABC-type transport system involved in multi-copper enzyme maturation permease subunit
MIGLLRLESAGVLRARWLAVSCALAASLVAFFVVLATRESAVLAFTGFDRVVNGVGVAGLLFLPLLAVLSTSQAIPQARQNGALEWILSHPVSRSSCFWSLFVPRALAVCGPVIGAVLALGIAAAVLGEAVPYGPLGRFFVLLAGQGVCFAALGMAAGALSRSAEQSLLAGLVVWASAVALLDFALIGTMLRWRLPPEMVFALASFNPVQAGRLGLLSGADPDLGLLGPVGTWITVNLGPAITLTYAIAWPIVLGAIALLLARAAFLRRDVP